MTIRSAPFYWLSCDAEGCENRCPREDDEFVAFSGDDQAIIVALESEWQITDEGRHLCPDHVQEEE